MPMSKMNEIFGSSSRTVELHIVQACSLSWSVQWFASCLPGTCLGSRGARSRRQERLNVGLVNQIYIFEKLTHFCVWFSLCVTRKKKAWFTSAKTPRDSMKVHKSPRSVQWQRHAMPTKYFALNRMYAVLRFGLTDRKLRLKYHKIFSKYWEFVFFFYYFNIN